MKILHVAPINVAGVPYSMMQMQQRFGHHARLVSLHTNTLTFPEDICLSLPLPRNALAMSWRRYKQAPAPSAPMPKIHQPSNILEELYFKYDDWRRENVVLRCIERNKLDDYDIIHYDGGLDFFRDARIARRWKREGKKIVCHYMGSDLRIRGVDPRIDELSDLNITNESDHLHLHPDIHYIYIPFDHAHFTRAAPTRSMIRIIHSPTNRDFKGTQFILPVIDQLKKIRQIEFILAERVPHSELIRIKSTCDIAIEQVGNLGGTGYGVNSLETLALGIPTVTEMTEDYLAWLPENPFVLASRETLLDRLVELVDSVDLRRNYGESGLRWVAKYHSFEAVHSQLSHLYRDHGIL